MILILIYVILLIVSMWYFEYVTGKNQQIIADNQKIIADNQFRINNNLKEIIKRYQNENNNTIT
jgi:hypothetical protein